MIRKKLEEYIGERFNHLTITGIDRERRKLEQSCNTYVFADCDCGVKGLSYNLRKLKTGETKSCGHLKVKHDKPNKFNKIIIDGECGKIYVNGKQFLFDTEDLQLLKDKYWYEDDYGYLTHCFVNNKKNNYIKFHRLVCKAKKGEFVDHINKNKNDNRKCNLRICLHKENDRNSSLRCTNKSGVTGVYFDKSRNKWCARITYDFKSIFLGRFEDKKDAIKARLIGEKKFFKNFAPQKELFNIYFGENYEV